MKNTIVYLFFCALYTVLGLHYFVPVDFPILTWRTFAECLLFFAAVAALARWTTIAFQARPKRLPAGQKIVGVEEEEPQSVIDVVRPIVLQREEKKPRLKKRSGKFNST